VPGPLIVRRIPELNPTTNPGQNTLFDMWRFHAFFTTTDPDVTDTVAADKTHRHHAICVCRCGAPGWRTTRLGGGDPERDSHASDVIGFVLGACPGRAVGSAKLIVCALRSLLRWLHLTGTVPSLAAAVPSVAGWRLSGLPKGLEPGQLRSLLASCDRRTPTGRRDHAIMLLLARLGLRAGEVARLGLDDIDWRRSEIAVLGKGNRAERLPMPAEVGAAIAGYLRRGRPGAALGRSVST
jgi:integrase